MTQAFPQNNDVSIRAVPHGDLEAIDRFAALVAEEADLSYSINPNYPPKPLHAYAPLRLLNTLLHRPQTFGAYPHERDSKPQGIIQISPFNRTRSTWRVEQVAVLPQEIELVASQPSSSSKENTETPAVAVATPGLSNVGSLLLRHCFETIWEARTWLLEVNVNNKDLLALYRQNGFQPLAHMTYWEIDSDQIQALAEREPDLPNLLPISNTDAQLLYQLDTTSMPPLVRQVFDRHIADFKASLIGSLMRGLRNWLNRTEVISGYVFEPQRKAAIGYFQIQLCRDGSSPHQAQLTVNPAYTWLYPELMSQMARIAKDLPAQSLRLASSDYQPEREEYLERLGASRIAHTLMMSRSVWHKVRESRLGAFENIPEMLQGLKPVRKPIPSRISSTPLPDPNATGQTANAFAQIDRSSPSLRVDGKTDFSDSPPEGSAVNG